jgi:O-antigen ligase
VLQDRNYTVIGAFGLFTLCLLVGALLQKPVFIFVPFIFLLGIIAIYYFKQFWYLLLLTLPLSTEMEITESLSLDFPDEGIMMGVSFIFLLLILTKSLQINKAFFQNKLIQLLGACLVWYIITAAFSTYPIYSLKFVLAKFWFIVPFVIMPTVLLHTKKDIAIAVGCIAASILCTVLIVLYKHSTQSFLFDTINNAVAPFYRNHVNYAAMLVCTLPIVVCFYFFAKNKLQKQLLFLVVMVMLIALIVSYSRGAWLALLVGVIALFCIKKSILGYSFLLSISLLIITIAWLAKDNRYINYHPNYKKTIYHANFNDHIDATFKGTDMSNAERFNRWIAGVRMVDENRLTGFGPNTFYPNYKPYIVTYFKTWVSDNKEKSTVHNYFLLTLIEQGWFGFILLVAFVFSFFKNTEKLYHKATDKNIKKMALCIGVVMSMVVTLNMLSDLVETDKIGSLFYLCIGMLVWVNVNLQREVIKA